MDSRSLFAVGIDPGTTIGVAAVGLTTTLRVIETRSLRSVAELHRWLATYGVPDVIAIEWWEYQGARRARGTSQAAEQAGRVAGALEVLGRPAEHYTRSEIFQSLGLRANADKRTVEDRVTALVDFHRGQEPSNDHEADAVAAGIAGLNRLRMKEFLHE